MEKKEWRELTFSQRDGKVALPESLEVGVLTEIFRNRIWLSIERSISDSVEYGEFTDLEIWMNKGGKIWNHFFFSYFVNVLNSPHDKAIFKYPYEAREWLRPLILGKEPHEVLTMLEHLLRLPSTPKNLINEIEECFQYSLYLIDRSNEPVCIIPTTSEEMKENVKRSLENINKSELVGTKTHLGNAAQCLNNNSFSDSIRESIHAVESAAREIDPKSSRTLGPALNSLENHGMLKHPALKEAFTKLYGYTNDEKGIRHPLIGKDATDVGFDEAIFMYGACVSFVDYLVSKQRKSKE